MLLVFLFLLSELEAEVMFAGDIALQILFTGWI